MMGTNRKREGTVFTVRKFTGSLGIGFAAVGSAIAVALSSATPAVAANQALMLNGIGLSIGGGLLPDIVMKEVLGGAFATYDRTAVPWPMQANPVTGEDSMFLTDSVAVGVDNLNAAIKEALTKIGPGEHVTVVGLSAGALVADEELRRLLTDPNAPDKSQLNIVVVADSSRANFNQNRYDTVLSYQYRPPVDTKYDTVVVVAEYDGFADFPDRVWNIVAVVNAFAGEILNHVPSVFTDLSTVPASNITETVNSLGGVTTSYFIPSDTLPLVELLPFLAPQEEALRKIVDAGYERNDPKNAADTPAVATDVAAAAAAEPPAAVEAPVVTPALADEPPAEEVAVESNQVAEPPAEKAVAATEPVADKTDKAAVSDAPETAKVPSAAAVAEAPTSRRSSGANRHSEGSGVTRRASVKPPRSSAASRADK